MAGHRFRRQVPIGAYIADFACLEAKLIIELDGGQHQEQAEYDARRDRQIEAEGFRVLRFWDNQVFQETQAVLEVILRALEGETCPHPSPPPRAEEGANTQAEEGVEAPSLARSAGEGWGGGAPQVKEGAERGTPQAGDGKPLPPFTGEGWDGGSKP